MPDPVTRLVLAVFRANQALVTEGDRRVAEVGLNSARWKALGAITLEGASLTAADIGRRMGLSRQGAQKQLDLLTGEGLVVRVDNPDHKRAPLYALTPAGEARYAAAMACWTPMAELLRAGIPDATLHEAAALLDTLSHRTGAQP